MIPQNLSRANILASLDRIGIEGIPKRREARDYCLIYEGSHYPPKYTIAVAHEIMTGRFLRSDEFSGGPESTSFLEARGFSIVECHCGGIPQSAIGNLTIPVSRTQEKVDANPGHSEHCQECKIRVQQLLERLFGTCIREHRFGWSTSPSGYMDTPIYPALNQVLDGLQNLRGFDDFIRSRSISSCDFYIPEPGFVVEFDESQHFTLPRGHALSLYPDNLPMGFPVKRWISLCQQHLSIDNQPPYRDEQRAWYDSLRDLLPPLHNLGPTVRIYSLDATWCSLNPNNDSDVDFFREIALGNQAIPVKSSPSGKYGERDSKQSLLHVAMVFPEVTVSTSNGIPPAGGGAQQPLIPSVASFKHEAINFVLFPEGYVNTADEVRMDLLSKLSSELGVPLLVGAVDNQPDSMNVLREWQVLILFEPGHDWKSLYTKHSTADGIAFEMPVWDAETRLHAFEIEDTKVGATICHDHYLGLLPRFLSRQGVQVWVNPSFDNVVDIKWSSILRLRAIENRFFSLCTLHTVSGKRGRTHPFAFSPEGDELTGRIAGSQERRPLSACLEPGIYMVDLDLTMARQPLDWNGIPQARQNPRSRVSRPARSAKARLIDHKPGIKGISGWQSIEEDTMLETDSGRLLIGIVRDDELLDSSRFFEILDLADKNDCYPIIWNLWEKLPTDSNRLVPLLFGRSIECCAPVLLSDRHRIYEHSELANLNKIPVRRPIESSGEQTIDLDHAWGLSSAFKMVSSHLKRRAFRDRALDRYRSLG